MDNENQITVPPSFLAVHSDARGRLLARQIVDRSHHAAHKAALLQERRHRIAP